MQDYMQTPGRTRTVGKRALARDRLVERINIATEMRMGGATLLEISKKIGVNESRVSRILKAHREELLARIDQNTQEWIAEQISRYEAVARLAARGFTRSNEDRQRIEQTNGPDGKIEKTIIEGQNGNPAYLGKIIDALARIDKLMGTEAPSRQEVDATLRATPQLSPMEEAAAMDASILPPGIMYRLTDKGQDKSRSNECGNSNGNDRSEPTAK